MALDVFGRSGDRGGSLREVAQRVGMSQAGVLHHFGSKTGLLLAVLQRREDADQAEASGDLDDHVAFARSLLERGAQAPGVFHLHVTLSAEATDPAHPAHQHFAERYRRVAQEFADRLRESADAGRLAPDVDVEALAHLLIATMDGLQLQRLLNDEVDVVRSFDLLVAALLEVYGAHPTHEGD